MFGHRIVVSLVVLALFTSACTASRQVEEASDQGSDDAGEPTSTPESEVSPGERSDVEAGQDGELAVPAGFEVVAVRALTRAGPPAGVATDVVTIVGSSVQDPRFLELTLFEFPDAEAADAGSSFVGPAKSVTPIDLSSGLSFAFLPARTGPGQHGRSDLELLGSGPSLDSVIRGRYGDRGVLVGGARILQPADVDRLLEALDGESIELSEADPLPGMSVLAAEPLGDGAVVELRSVEGASRFEIYDGVGPEWFDYLARDALANGVTHPDLGLDGMVAVQPPTTFGFSGQPLDPARLYWWIDGRLTVLSHPNAFDQETINGLASTSLRWTPEELVGLMDVDPVAESEPAPNDRDVAGETQALSNLQPLQDFVETARRAPAGPPIVFDFVDVFETAGIEGFFVSENLWLVMSALDLVDEDQDRDGADMARVERVRGTPGSIAFQPTETETRLVVVHEMTHVVDDLLDKGADLSRELVSPSQALLEGNAHRVAYDYAASLPESDQELLPEAPGIFPPSGDERLSAAMQDVLEFPYDEGLTFATAVAANGGEAAIDLAIGKPPTSSEQILFPDAYFAQDDPEAVSPPTADGTGEIVDEGTLGAYLLTLAVRERTGATGDLLSQWSGDTYILVRRTGDVCLLATVRMDTAAAALELATILDGGDTSASPSGRDVQLESCL